MKYLNFVAGDDLPGADELAVMQREIPGWAEELTGRGVRLLGRPLDIPETAVTVRVRDGETLVTDGPFVEAKEFIAGFDVLECADLDEVIATAASGPVARFMTIEIRTFAGQPELGDRASAFGRHEDGTTSPYALIVWTGGTPPVPPVDQRLMREVGAWRQDLVAGGLHILGGTLDGADTATTLRVRDGKTLLGDGPFFKTGEIIAAIDVVGCADRDEAAQLAAAHPAVKSNPVEVRPFE